MGELMGSATHGTPSRSLRVVVVAVIAVVAALLGTLPAGADAGDPREEADWILTAQLADGALATHSDRTFVNPYFGGFAATGLAAATRATGNGAYAEAAWRFVEWYAAHMDARGYVTDYQISGGSLVSTGDADSTDAYAGLFLLAVDAVQTAAPNGARLLALAPAVRRGVAAIRSTQRVDGLTGAKPAWMVAYLMNQAEAFAGLQAATRLALVIGDRALARDGSTAAARIQRGVDRLWNPSTDAFDWAVHPNGARQPTSWAQLYPDAISQVWAVRYGLVRGSRARVVLLGFLRAHPNAHDPAAIDLIDGGPAPTGYWPGIATPLGLVDAGAPARFLAGTSAAAARSGRAWPYSVQTAADVIRLATGL